MPHLTCPSPYVLALHQHNCIPVAHVWGVQAKDLRKECIELRAIVQGYKEVEQRVRPHHAMLACFEK